MKTLPYDFNTNLCKELKDLAEKGVLVRTVIAQFVLGCKGKVNEGKLT
jgi:hypothetical protein